MTISKAEKARRAATSAKTAAAAPPASNETIEAPVTRETKGVGDIKVTSRKVVVVCKMPRGVYLQHTQFIDQDVRVSGGGVEKRKIPMRVGPQVRLKPAVLPFGMMPNYPIICGFSLTRDIDAEFWRTYAEQNSQLELITSGLMKAFDTEADATAYCNEFEKLRHGLEPLAQEKDPRVEPENNPNLTNIEIDSDSDVPGRKRA
jgi:hypothetical protein